MNVDITNADDGLVAVVADPRKRIEVELPGMELRLVGLERPKEDGTHMLDFAGRFDGVDELRITGNALSSLTVQAIAELLFRPCRITITIEEEVE